MEFVEAYRSFWKNYFNFKGRATRSEFWFVVVWNMIIGIVLGLGLSLSFVGTAFSLVALGNGFSANVIFTDFIWWIISDLWFSVIYSLFKLGGSPMPRYRVIRMVVYRTLYHEFTDCCTKWWRNLASD